MDKPTPSPNNKQPFKNDKNWLAYSGMAFEMFAIIGVFAFAGHFLDKKFQTNPVLVLVFLVIGLILAFYRIFKQLT